MFLLSSVKSADIIQIAAITEANPKTKPTNSQILAPRASIQPPLYASPFIYKIIGLSSTQIPCNGLGLT